MATALSAEAADPLRGLARYEHTRRPRASRVVLTARERGLSNHLTSPWAARRRDLDRVATAGEPARPGGARRGLARRLRRELSRRTRRLKESSVRQPRGPRFAGRRPNYMSPRSIPRKTDFYLMQVLVVAEAGMPVMARPMIRMCISSVPS